MITYNRTQFGWGRLLKPAYPDDVDNGEYFASIPPHLDRLAKAGRIHHYQRVRNSVETRKIASRNGIPSKRNGIPSPEKWLELKVAVEFTQQFVEAPNGLVQLPDPGAPILGTHSVSIIGVSETHRKFLISNSWGVEWGDRSQGLMPFEFFDRFLVESWAIDERNPNLPSGSELVVRRWDEPDPLGTRLFGIEIFDPSEDERIGWSFAVLRDEFVDVEELFVKPNYRHRGHGGRLAGMLQELAKEQGRPIRAWVSFADACLENRSALTAILTKLGLGIHRAGVRWAAYKATPEEPRSLKFPFIRVPERPAAVYTDQGRDVAHVETLHGSVLKFDDPFGPAIAAEEWEASD